MDSGHIPTNKQKQKQTDGKLMVQSQLSAFCTVNINQNLTILKILKLFLIRVKELFAPISKTNKQINKQTNKQKTVA